MKLFVTSTGEGKNPTLFLHGLWGGGNYFREYDFSDLPVLPSYYPDELGFGKSPKPDVTYTPQAHIDSILESIPNQQCTIVANSFGTVLALQMAVLHPEKVKRLVLISPLLYRNSDEAKKYLSTRFIPQLTIHHPFLGQIICTLSCRFRLLRYIAPFVSRGRRKKILRNSIYHTWNSYHSTFTECILKRPDFPLLENIKGTIPTCIIFGEHDNYINKKPLLSLKGLKLKIQEIKNGSHQILYENFLECKKHIEEFLKV